jgi:hypothetical protein
MHKLFNNFWIILALLFVELIRQISFQIINIKLSHFWLNVPNYFGLSWNYSLSHKSSHDVSEYYQTISSTEIP